jgi:hypothetical protein
LLPHPSPIDITKETKERQGMEESKKRKKKEIEARGINNKI